MKLRLAAGLAAVVGLLAGPFLSGSVDARPVAKSTVAVLANPDYVDTESIADGGELENLEADLEKAGHTVKEFTDISAAGFAAALDGSDVLLIPELEGESGSSLYDDMGADGIAVVADWVESGGRLVLMAGFHVVNGLNSLFGFSTVEGSGDDAVLDAASSDTEFADGPADLPSVDATSGVQSSSLPDGTTEIYVNEGVASTVGSVPVGDGAVIYLGWDWFPDAGEDPAPATFEDEAAWATVLDLSVSQPEVTADSPAAGALRLTMDSPSTQPVFVVLVINGTTHSVPIAAKTTEANFDVGGAAVVAWSVPGWGIGEGSVEVAGATAAPPAAEPAPVAPTFTG